MMFYHLFTYDHLLTNIPNIYIKATEHSPPSDILERAVHLDVIYLESLPIQGKISLDKNTAHRTVDLELEYGKDGYLTLVN